MHTPLTGVATAQAQLKLWDQCGGEGGNCKDVGTCINGPFPGKDCPAGSSCLKQSNWYYQCLPTEGYTCIPTAGNTPGAPAGGAQYTLKMWDQCGGMGGNCAGYQCVDGAYPNYACPPGDERELTRAGVEQTATPQSAALITSDCLGTPGYLDRLPSCLKCSPVGHSC